MKKKKLCSCALINGHFLNCHYKNVIIGEGSVTIDFNALKKMIEEMENRVIQENGKKDSRKKTQIFVAPVIKRQKKNRQPSLRRTP